VPETQKSTKTVLVLEDNRIQREGIAAVLRDKGYEVELAENVTEAWRYLRGDPLPGLVLLDMMLPGVDGWQFLNQLTRDPALAHVPVIIATGLGIASKEWAASLGAAGLLRKRFDAVQPVLEVERFL
jgi:CheY-like chemotaxis protein